MATRTRWQWVENGALVQTGYVSIRIRVSPVDGKVTSITWCLRGCSGTVGWGCSRWDGHLVWLVTACHDTETRTTAVGFNEDATRQARGYDCFTPTSLLGFFQLSLPRVLLFPFFSFFLSFFQSFSFFVCVFVWCRSLSLLLLVSSGRAYRGRNTRIKERTVARNPKSMGKWSVRSATVCCVGAHRDRRVPSKVLWYCLATSVEFIETKKHTETRLIGIESSNKPQGSTEVD